MELVGVTRAPQKTPGRKRRHIEDCLLKTDCHFLEKGEARATTVQFVWTTATGLCMVVMVVMYHMLPKLLSNVLSNVCFERTELL